MIYICVYGDQIMIGQSATPSDIGVYAVAVKLSKNWAFLVLTITRSVILHIIEAKKISEELYYQRLQKIWVLLGIGG